MTEFKTKKHQMFKDLGAFGLNSLWTS